MLNNFQTIIFREVDETNPERGVWVRMSPSHWGVSIATFKEQPTEETPEWQAMTSIHFDPCFNNQSKIVVWNEHCDPENSDGREVVLVESIDDWKPMTQEEPDPEHQEKRIWLDHTVYKMYRNEARSWEAMILPPTSQAPTILSGEKTSGETVEQIKETYGESAERLPDVKFQEEVERRTTHSEEMLALLKDTWTGQDLRDWHVYGSILRPMMGITIEGTVYLNGNGARYHQYEIYTYVVAKEPLDARTREHYTLVTISHP